MAELSQRNQQQQAKTQQPSTQSLGNQEEDKDGKKNKPSNSRFKQQTLPAWKPILTPRTVLPTFTVIGVIFLSLGIALYVTSEDVKEQTWDYTECTLPNSTLTCASLLENRASGYTNTSQPLKRCRCEVSIELTSSFDAHTTYLYYALDNYFQNHRRYVKSRWDPQLRSQDLTGGVDCDPLTKDAAGLAYLPCGLVANSLFNDTIRLFQCASASDCTTRTPVAMTGSQITWASDRDNKFKNPTSPDALCSYPDWQTQTTRPQNWPVPLCQLGMSVNATTAYNPWAPEFGSSGRGLENEDLIVWMRTAGKE